MRQIRTAECTTAQHETNMFTLVAEPAGRPTRKKRCYSWGCQTKRTYCVLATTAGSKTGRSIVGKLINAACETWTQVISAKLRCSRSNMSLLVGVKKCGGYASLFARLHWDDPCIDCVVYCQVVMNAVFTWICACYLESISRVDGKGCIGGLRIEWSFPWGE